jgi:3-oxoacyl-(acyl-carrier-protein) synthase
MRRVAITGMGAINALGHDAAATWSAMREGRPAIGPITNIATDLLLVKIAAEVRDYDPIKHFDSSGDPARSRLAIRPRRVRRSREAGAWRAHRLHHRYRHRRREHAR